MGFFGCARTLAMRRRALWASHAVQAPLRTTACPESEAAARAVAMRIRQTIAPQVQVFWKPAIGRYQNQLHSNRRGHWGPLGSPSSQASGSSSSTRR
jgi:hypothetical protein